MFTESLVSAEPEILTPDWWNLELATNRGDEIVAVLGRFYGEPLTRGPYVPELGSALPFLLSQIEVFPKELGFNPHEYMVDVFVRRNIKTSFAAMLTRVAEQTAPTREVANLFEPVVKALGKFWTDLERSWALYPVSSDAASLMIRNGFRKTLFNFVLFSVSGNRRLAMLHRVFLEYYRLGNFPMGELKSRSDRKHFLVYIAEPFP